MNLRAAARLLAFAATACISGLVVGGCTSLLGDFSTAQGDASVGGGGAADSAADGVVSETGTGAGLGAACTSAGQCATGHCVDAVCCESACDGTCESCDIAGSPGHCLPIAANTDPDRECISLPSADGGTPDAASGAVEAGGAGASSDAASAAIGSDATVAIASDAGAIQDASGDLGFNVPDGGIMSDDTMCVGACNGRRACAFPDKTKVCGTQFCNTSAQAAQFACDGTGHCSLDEEDCVNYSCAGTGCGTTCSQVSDCLPTSFCNSFGKCQPQLGLGVACSLDTMCQMGHCVQNVCCSSACNIPGGTCVSSQAVGECKCAVDCGDGGTCQLFYRDADGDGFGDKSGTLAAGTAAVGCAGSPPSGFLANDTDCDDHDAKVFPGQTAFYGTPSLGVGTFDYNCDGTLEKSVGEYPGLYCSYCTGAANACSVSATCSAAGAQSGMSCGTVYGVGFCNPITHICSISRYCANAATGGFLSPVGCGATGSFTSCGTCAAANAVAGATSSPVQQQCH